MVETTISFSELGKLLKNGWPSKKEMRGIPFGDKLNELGESKDHGNHVKSVLDCMCKLLSQTPIQAVKDHNSPESDDGIRIFLEVWHQIDSIFSNSSMDKEKIKNFLRIAALYHDIGKIIHKDRHPLEGFQLIKNVDKKEAKRLASMSGSDEIRLLGQLIKYHDLFGVVGTGEGSAPVLIDAIAFHSDAVNDQLATLSLLLFLNIADISGVIPLKSTKVGTLASDWLRLCYHIKNANGDRQKFANELIISEQKPTQAIERIRRLLLEQAPVELCKSLNSPGQIGDILSVTMGTQFYDFWSDFALICKLDYALRFVGKLENGAVSNQIESDKVIEIFISLIKELVQSYSALTKRLDGSRRRIGIEVSGWTRTEQIEKSLINILFSDLPLGVGWAAEEATAWYME